MLFVELIIFFVLFSALYLLSQIIINCFPSQYTACFYHSIFNSISSLITLFLITKDLLSSFTSHPLEPFFIKLIKQVHCQHKAYDLQLKNYLLEYMINSYSLSQLLTKEFFVILLNMISIVIGEEKLLIFASLLFEVVIHLKHLNFASEPIKTNSFFLDSLQLVLYVGVIFFVESKILLKYT